MFAFLDVPVSGAFQLVVHLSEAIRPLLGATSTAVAIVLFTCLVRLLLVPLSRAAVRGERARSVLAPRLQELQRKHKGNPERLQREAAALYQESGTSMFAGCLPMLVQAPFFTIMYRLFVSGTVHGQPNTLLHQTLFGVPLSQHWLPVLAGPGVLSPAGAMFLGLFTLLGIVATVFVRRQAPAAEAPAAARLLRFLPYGTMLVACVLPLAAGIYLLTTTAWTLAERTILHRANPPADSVP